MSDPEKPPSDEFWGDVLRNLGLLQVVLTEIFGFSLAGIALGYLGSKYLGLPSWSLAVTGSAGLGLGMYRLYRWVRKQKS